MEGVGTDCSEKGLLRRQEKSVRLLFYICKIYFHSITYLIFVENLSYINTIISYLPIGSHPLESMRVPIDWRKQESGIVRRALDNQGRAGIKPEKI